MTSIPATPTKKSLAYDFMRKKYLGYSAIYIDASWLQILRSMFEALKPGDQPALKRKVESLFSRNGYALMCLSVRSALDLYLQRKKFPKGSEILMTSVNIPDLSQMFRFHGLIPVPVDIDPDTLLPTIEDVKEATTEKTVAMMISHLYGTNMEVDSLIDYCHENKLDFLEDSAETFCGLKYQGNPRADFTYISFGTIKTCTSLGGGIVIVRGNEMLYREMKEVQEAYPLMKRKDYWKKILKAMLCMATLNVTSINGFVRRFSDPFGFDYQSAIVSMVRGFPADDSFLFKFRVQPNAPMLAFFLYRLTTFDQPDYDEHQKQLRDIEKELNENGVKTPGNRWNASRHFWLYPIIVADKELCFKMLQAKGVDAYKQSTQLRVVEPPIGYKDAKVARHMMNNILYMPLHRLVPKNHKESIRDEIIKVANFVDRLQKEQNGPTQAKL